MSSDAYELVALTARYVFAGLMLLIVLRAARLTAVDSRRAAKLRRLSPMTGVSGELVVLEGDGNARRGMRYPVIREGMIGSSRRADVRIRHSSVRRRHAYFQLTERGLKLRDHAGARLRSASGEPVRELLLGDGGEFAVGRIRLLLVLNDATAAQSARREGAEDELFAAGGLDPYDAGMASEPARRADDFAAASGGIGNVPGTAREDFDDWEPDGPQGWPEEDAFGRPSRQGMERAGSAEDMEDALAARRARTARREEFRQAMREGDALERRTAPRSSASARRATEEGIGPRITTGPSSSRRSAEANAAARRSAAGRASQWDPDEIDVDIPGEDADFAGEWAGSVRQAPAGEEALRRSTAQSPRRVNPRRTNRAGTDESAHRTDLFLDDADGEDW